VQACMSQLVADDSAYVCGRQRQHGRVNGDAASTPHAIERSKCAAARGEHNRDRCKTEPGGDVVCVILNPHRCTFGLPVRMLEPAHRGTHGNQNAQPQRTFTSAAHNSEHCHTRRPGQDRQAHLGGSTPIVHLFHRAERCGTVSQPLDRPPVAPRVIAGQPTLRDRRRRRWSGIAAGQRLKARHTQPGQRCHFRNGQPGGPHFVQSGQTLSGRFGSGLGGQVESVSSIMVALHGVSSPLRGCDTFASCGNRSRGITPPRR
jgi:hypothetical protein